jgi:hypothetical protein
MTRRLPVASSPGPLEDYALRFDDLLRARAQREGFRRYLEGLLLPAERNKTLTALANTEPVEGAQRKEAQRLQWFLSESGWDQQELNGRRLELLSEDSATAPNGEGVLIIDEHGDRKWGKHTAHVGKQWLANMGKTENGVVSVSSVDRRRSVLPFGGRALHAQAPLRGWQIRPSLPHQSEDSPTTRGTLGRDWRALSSCGCGLLLWRRRGFQASFERARDGIRAGVERVALVVAPRGADRSAVGGRRSGRME